MKKRCDWVPDDALYIAYHDNEWGVPVHDDQTLFEHLILDVMQAVGMVNDHTIGCFRNEELSS